MEKRILQDYMDACELVRETEEDIQRILQKKKTVVQADVKGSSSDFPYTGQHFRIHGMIHTARDGSRLRHEEEILAQRKESAEKIKMQVEKWMLSIPARMQRIVKYRYLEGMPWEQVAVRMGKKATGDSVRKELERFLKEI